MACNFEMVHQCILVPKYFVFAIGCVNFSTRGGRNSLLIGEVYSDIILNYRLSQKLEI